jgi:hypothetical protein
MYIGKTHFLNFSFHNLLNKKNDCYNSFDFTKVAKIYGNKTFYIEKECLTNFFFKKKN